MGSGFKAHRLGDRPRTVKRSPSEDLHVRIDEMPCEERRRHPRQRLEEGYVIHCTSRGEGASNNLASKLLDISRSGACLITVGRLREGLPMDLEITFPGRRDRFRARAVVRWSQTVESTGPIRRTAHVAGVRFEEILDVQGAKGAPRTGRLAPPPVDEPQRRHKRFLPQEVDLVCLPRGFWRRLGFGTNIARHLKDLSLGGAQIVSSTRLKPGRKVDLRLKFRKPACVIQARGEVRWCKRDTLSVEPRWYMGVTFRRIAPGSNQDLEAVARYFLRS
jgi:c-di-GMP-binding flagellar brake protein YcgR